jgi:hypothetical protein
MHVKSRHEENWNWTGFDRVQLKALVNVDSKFASSMKAEIFLIVEQLSASQEGHCSVDFVAYLVDFISDYRHSLCEIWRFLGIENS